MKQCLLHLKGPIPSEKLAGGFLVYQLWEFGVRVGTEIVGAPAYVNLVVSNVEIRLMLPLRDLEH